MSTTANAEGAFRLFYDFNSPPRNGIYWCLAEDTELPSGTRVLFGCESDDLLAFGQIVSRRDGQYGVVMEGEPFYPSERWVTLQELGARDGQLVELALFLSPVWEADNEDDVQAAKVAVNAFLAGEEGA